MRVAGMDVIYTPSSAPKGKLESLCRWLQDRTIRTFVIEKPIAIDDVCTHCLKGGVGPILAWMMECLGCSIAW